jgi:hypothetical protein
VLRRHPEWNTGHALYAIGGNVLLNPVDPSQAADVLVRAGATDIETRPSRSGATLLIAQSSA